MAGRFSLGQRALTTVETQAVLLVGRASNPWVERGRFFERQTSFAIRVKPSCQRLTGPWGDGSFSQGALVFGDGVLFHVVRQFSWDQLSDEVLNNWPWKASKVYWAI